MFNNGEDDLSFSEVTFLKTEFSFRKDDFYPNSFKWEVKFSDESNIITELKQRGKDEKINELQSIEILEEIKTQLY